MDKPLVSVMIITYNRADYITRAIESLQNQSFSNWEAVIIDDCSKDKTDQIISQIQTKDPRVFYKKLSTKSGISSSRNLALSISKGKYVAVLDSDDYWSDKDKLKKQVNFLENNLEKDCVLVGANAWYVNNRGKRKFFTKLPTDDCHIKKDILIKNPFVHSSVLYNRNSVIQIGGYNERLLFCEDYDLWLRLGKSWKLANLTDNCVDYTVHERGVTVSNLISVSKINLALVLKNREYPNFFIAFIRAFLRIIKLKILMI